MVQRPAGAPVTVWVATPTAALGDADGDGRTDVWVLEGQSVRPLLAAAWDAGVAQPLPAVPTAIPLTSAGEARVVVVPSPTWPLTL